MYQENGTKKIKNPKIKTLQEGRGLGQKAKCTPRLPCHGGLPALEPTPSLPVENRRASGATF